MEKKYNFKNDKGDSLFIAAELGQLDIVKTFIKHNMPINNRNSNGETPLMAAIIKKHIDVAKFLIDNGANTKIKDNSGMNAYSYAKKYQRTETIDLLEKNNNFYNEMSK